MANRERNVEHVVRTLNELRRTAGDEAVLRGLGISTTDKPFGFRDFPQEDPGQDVTVLKIGRLNISTKQSLLGDAYTNVGRSEGTVIVPIERTSSGLFVVTQKQHRGAADMPFEEVAAGGRKPGESYEDVARREVQEETGYRVISAQQFPGKLYPGPGYTDEREVHMAAEVVPNGSRATDKGDSHEITEVYRTHLTEAARTLAYESRMPNDDKVDVKSGFGILAAWAREVMHVMGRD